MDDDTELPQASLERYLSATAHVLARYPLLGTSTLRDAIDDLGGELNAWEWHLVFPQSFVTVRQIQALSLTLLHEHAQKIYNAKTCNALFSGCAAMLNRYSEQEWYEPGQFDTWLVVSAAFLLLNEKDCQELSSRYYFYLPYQHAFLLEKHFGSVESANLYTARLQAIHDRCLPRCLPSSEECYSPGSELQAMDSTPATPQDWQALPECQFGIIVDRPAAEPTRIHDALSPHCDEPILSEIGVESEKPIKSEIGVESEEPIISEIGVESEKPIKSEIGVESEEPIISEIGVERDDSESVGELPKALPRRPNRKNMSRRGRACDTCRRTCNTPAKTLMPAQFIDMDDRCEKEAREVEDAPCGEGDPNSKYLASACYTVPDSTTRLKEYRCDSETSTVDVFTEVEEWDSGDDGPALKRQTLAEDGAGVFASTQAEPHRS
ncbi:hypothetical protein NLG97_g1191 [Lecanicillium saksenae]|uniref:Uncharacterized protein n=1 Tax=Lecanicillium saksenae TaxID=468837 RepID=A0ACC1R4F9_9HYPO|nr:hypothetical protein NLG97_g1191 [Lecanicillium saksenae]